MQTGGSNYCTKQLILSHQPRIATLISLTKRSKTYLEWEKERELILLLTRKLTLGLLTPNTTRSLLVMMLVQKQFVSGTTLDAHMKTDKET